MFQVIYSFSAIIIFISNQSGKARDDMLKSLLWFIMFQFYRRYYNIKLAVTPEEKEKVFKFRHKIYMMELNYHALDMETPEEGHLYDEIDLSNNSLILYSGDIDNIIATLTLHIYDTNNVPTKFRSHYYLTDKILNCFKNIGELRYFQILPQYRTKKFLALSLFTYLYMIQAKMNAQHTPEVIFATCFPGLLNKYLRIGCYHYINKMSFDLNVLLIPLAYSPFDMEYLRKQKNINYIPALYYKNQLKSQRIKLSTYELPKISFIYSREEVRNYIRNIQNESNQNFLSFLLDTLPRLIILPVTKDKPVLKKDVLDYDMYFLIEGQLGVYQDDHLVATLSPGNLIGEMALLAETHKRHSDVYSLTEAKLILIPRNWIQKLERKNKPAYNRLMKFLIDSLISKLVESNKIIIQNLKNQK